MLLNWMDIFRTQYIKLREMYRRRKEVSAAKNLTKVTDFTIVSITMEEKSEITSISAHIDFKNQVRIPSAP